MNERREVDKPVATKEMYYGVHIPADVQIAENERDSIKVFEVKEDALAWVKSYKKARFKAFYSYDDAVDFALHGPECPNNNGSVDLAKTNENPLVGEKPSQFRGPTSQNLVKLRKNIECGDIETVHRTIWENPRYLIGVGDTPSILQEGYRYNGLHIATKAKNAAMCNLILNTISDIEFISKLYVDDRNPEARSKILLDLYMNTPDKGLNETPLHFASKHGAADCVEVLVSFPQCDRHLKNKYGLMPSEIICDRYTNNDDLYAIGSRIAALLEESYYVPVVRSEDNCAPPMIGEPFSPTSPPNFNRDPLSPRMEIHAYAGPMNKEGADKFRKIWKTPPRTLQFGSSPAPESEKTKNIASLRFRDLEKGLERFGNSLAHKMSVGWKEYWPFLNDFIDLASPEGLKLFEEYLANKIVHFYNSPITAHSVSPILQKNQCSMQLLPEVSPMSDLCHALQGCTLHDSKDNGLSSSSADNLTPFLCIDKSLQVFAKRISNSIKCLLMMDCTNCKVLEVQSKRLQHLMASYMTDSRFHSVDLHLVHHRLAYLTKSMLIEDVQDLNVLEKMLDLWFECCSKNVDCFSSDDEAVQNTVVHSRSQHTVCVLKGIQEFLNNDVVYGDVNTETESRELWRTLKPCACTWRNKICKKIHGTRNRNHRFANWSQDLPKRLSFSDEFCEDLGIMPSTNGDFIMEQYSSDDDMDDDKEQYYTPPASPSQMDSFEMLSDDDDDDENDVFHETRLPDFEVFIEGDIPTKMDYAAFNALKYTEVDLTPTKYPNIYRWQHAISLYNEAERTSWTSPTVFKCTLGQSTPARKEPMTSMMMSSSVMSPNCCASPKSSWLRITGANSPRASLKNRSRLAFN